MTTQKKDPASLPFEKLTAPQKMERVEAILQSEVYPMLQADAGGMEVLGIDGYTVRVRYQGACDGCPATQGGTHEFIEYILKTEIDPQIRVLAEGV